MYMLCGFRRPACESLRHTRFFLLGLSYAAFRPHTFARSIDSDCVMNGLSAVELDTRFLNQTFNELFSRAT